MFNLKLLTNKMKKLILTLCLIFTFTSLLNAQKLENGTFEKLSIEAKEFKNDLEWLKENSFFKTNFKAKELYKVTPNEIGKSYYGLHIDLGESKITDYKINNYVIIYKLSNGKKLIYLQRNIYKDKSIITEFIDIENGDYLDYFLYNCNEEFYQNYKISSSKLLMGGGIQAAKHSCFKTFSSCFNHVSQGLAEGPTNTVLCEWLPCATLAYGACTIAYTEGWIQSGSNFNSANCTKIY